MPEVMAPSKEEYRRLQSQAQEIYAAPDSAWDRPWFPDPPQEKLEPEEFTERLAEATFQCNDQLRHPFVHRLIRGKLNREELAGWVKADFPFLVNVIRSDAMIVAAARDLEEMRVQMHVLIEEAGEDLAGGEHPSHPQLWLRFGEALGVSAQEIRKAPVHPIMDLLLEAGRLRSLQRRIGEPPGNLRLSERTRSIVYPLWQKALEEHYGIPSEALVFFEEHGEADWGHGNIGTQILITRARTREDQLRLWEQQRRGLERGWMRVDVWSDGANWYRRQNGAGGKPRLYNWA